MTVYLSTNDFLRIYESSSQLTYSKKTIDFFASLKNNLDYNFCHENDSNFALLVINGVEYKFNKYFYNFEVIQNFKLLYEEISSNFLSKSEVKFSYTDEDFIDLMKHIRIFNEIKKALCIDESYIVKFLNS